MDNLTGELKIICEELKVKGEVGWDYYDDKANSEIDGAFGQIVKAFGPIIPGSEAHRRLCWLTMFVARRALVCWELYCDQRKPQETVDAILQWLMTGDLTDNWNDLCQSAKPSESGRPIIDCRYCSTAAAANSASNAAIFVISGNPIHAADSLADAYIAFDEINSIRRDRYRDWFLDIAVPAAYAQRELTPEEQIAYRSDDNPY